MGRRLRLPRFLPFYACHQGDFVLILAPKQLPTQVRSGLPTHSFVSLGVS
jgi:hypothetical protein